MGVEHMAFLRIQNKGVRDLALFTTWGASTGRTDSNAMGQFGNGSINGAFALHRDGKPITIYSGLRRVTYVELAEKTVTDPKGRSTSFVQMGVKISNRKPSPMGLALSTGELDWTPEMGVREFISNAIDYAQDDEYKIDVVDTPRPRDGYTSVFIPMDKDDAYDDVTEFYSTLSQRFLHFADCGADCPPVMPKMHDQSPPRIYRKGCFVKAAGRLPSIFDYNLGEELQIDEARNLGVGDCESAVADHICKDETALVSIFEKLAEDSEFFEASIASWRLSVHAEEWKRAFDTAFGYRGDVVIASPSHSLLIPHAYDSGFVPITIHSQAWYDCLVRAGVKTIDEAMRGVSENGCKLMAANREAIAVVDKVWEWLELLGETQDKPKPPIKSFVPLDAENNPMERCGGFFSPASGIVALRQGRETVRIAVEELGHYITGYDDLSREFEAWTFGIVAKMIEL
jgi:hypothetical protein